MALSGVLEGVMSERRSKSLLQRSLPINFLTHYGQHRESYCPWFELFSLKISQIIYVDQHKQCPGFHLRSQNHARTEGSKSRAEHLSGHQSVEHPPPHARVSRFRSLTPLDYCPRNGAKQNPGDRGSTFSHLGQRGGYVAVNFPTGSR